LRISVIFFKPYIKHGSNEPEKMEFKGNYAVETLLIKISEHYFGVKVSQEIEKLLKTRINGVE
jgi:hypothetical protein